MTDVRNVLVTGGTGVLGSRVVEVLRRRELSVRVLTRRVSPTLPSGVEAIAGDLTTRAGLGAAMDGVDAVVHCASDPRRHRDVDVAGTRTLLSAARRLSTPPHLVYISIVGCDRISYPYYRSKAVAELALAESGLPWTILRTTQFHDLVFGFARKLNALPSAPVPRHVDAQPVDTGVVAERLGELATNPPAGMAQEMGGPDVLSFAEIVRVVQRATGRGHRVWQVPAPGRFLAGLRAGEHLTPDHRVGPGFAEYVAERFRTPGHSPA